jgi:hypothetical protein
MAETVCNVMAALVAVPLIIGAWLVFFFLVDDTFFDGRYMDKIRAWNRRKRKSEEG